PPTLGVVAVTPTTPPAATATAAPAPTSPAPTAAPVEVEPVEVAAVQSSKPKPLDANHCAQNAYIQTQATIRAGAGGSLTSADGSLTVLLPPGQHDTYSLTIAASAVGADGTPAYGNLQPGRQWYMLSVTDSAGNLVARFHPPT